MRDPHVVSLTYRLVESGGVSYRDPEPVEFEAPHFSVELADGQLVLRPKQHFASESDARSLADRFVRGWEVHTRLTPGADALTFEYEAAEVVDRDPPPPGSVVLAVGSASMVVMGAKAEIHVTRSAYPEPPPTDFNFSPMIEIMWNRLQDYRAGREKLTAMGYFCLHVVESEHGDKRSAAQALGISRAVLKELGSLTSYKGDESEARKVPDGEAYTPLSGPERKWIVAVVEAIIERSARSFPDQLTMEDFPPRD